MTVLSIVQVRVGSTRLPGKALLPIAGRPMFLYAVDAAPWPKIVACPTSDYAITDICRELKLPFATHHLPEDVLTRFLNALKVAESYYEQPFSHILRITADCPMLTEALVLRFLRMCNKDPEVFWTNRPLDPDGLDLELFPIEALYLANELATTPHDREHVTSVLYSHMIVKRGRVSNLDPRVKISVDERDEYLLVKHALERRSL